MRRTIYIPNNGYVTQDDSFEYMGNGIFGDVFNAAKDLILSKPVKDLATNAATSFGTTLAKKGGEKAANKLVDKVFDSNKSNKSNKSNVTNTANITNSVEKTSKVSRKQNKDILKEIYGDGVFRGKGLRRV